MRNIEILFSNFLLYGEGGNIDYLRKIFPDDNFIDTQINDELYFIEHEVDMIYMGPMTEENLANATKKLLPHKDRLMELIELGKVVIVTGNALEIFGKLEDEKANKIESLELFDFKTVRNMNDRHSCAFLGLFQDKEIIGDIATFSQMYGNEDMHFIDVVLGFGFNRQSKKEGIIYKNFYGTNVLGPLLVMNPPFTEHICSLLGYNDPLPLAKRVYKAYENRKKIFYNAKEFRNQ